MISVIVTVREEQKYLVRCLNSIQRQTYQNVETKIVNMEEDSGAEVSEAVHTAHGEYVYFCSSDSVLTDNIMEALISRNGGSDICPWVQVCTLEKMDYAWNRISNISFYGKLFHREKLCNVLEEAAVKGGVDETGIVMAYLEQCKDMVEITDAMVYESEKRNLTGYAMPEEKSCDYWKKMLQKAGGCKEKVRHYITEGMGEAIAETKNRAEEIMYYAQELLHEEVWLNYVLSRETVKGWWKIIRSSENQKVYLDFISYLSSYENEVLSEMLLNECGINVKLYEIMKQNNQKTFLQILDKARQEGNLSVLREPIIMTIQEQPEDLSGSLLAEFVVAKYREGKLGLKTIITSLTAWIKFKI